MALSILVPTAAGPIGPGYVVEWQISAGPIPNDDFITVEVKDHSNTANLIAGSKVTLGHLIGAAVLGLNNTALPFAVGVNRFLAAGGAVDIVLSQWHANFNFVDSATFAGWTWDPLTGLGWLIAALATGSSNGASLESIYAAVHQNF